MSKRLTVELDYETTDRIVVLDLRDMYDDFCNDLEQRKNDLGCAIFEMDKDQDIKFIKKHLKAMRMILRFYGHDPKTESIQEYDSRYNRGS